MIQTLNLVYPDNGTIAYRIDKFPDGQQNVVIKNSLFVDEDTSTVIHSRLNSFRDLEIIACATASLRELGVKVIRLFVPYFLGSRSDRKFEEGGNNYLKNVICPIINSLKFNGVTVMDPHSDCLEMGLKNFHKISNANLVKHFMSKVIPSKGLSNILLISPDAGAERKIFKTAQEIGYTGEIAVCSKVREDGKIVNTRIDMRSNHTGDFVIIDDICDGGATFIGIAKELRKLYPDEKQKIHLIVTHGIFSKGFSELNRYFDTITCTNSYNDQTVDGISNTGSEKVNQLIIF